MFLLLITINIFVTEKYLFGIIQSLTEKTVAAAHSVDP